MAHPVTAQPRGHGHHGAPSLSVMDEIAQMDYFRIKENLKWSERCGCTCCGAKNTYKIMSAQGKTILTGTEESCCCCRSMCDAQRPFNMYLKNKQHKSVIMVDRPWRCQTGCCSPCCLQNVSIYAPVDVKVGAITQNWSCMRPSFDIEDGNGHAKLRVSGPQTCCNCGIWCEGSCWGLCCCRTTGFTIHDIHDDDNEIGMIRKEFSGATKEVRTEADTFYVTFPRDLALSLKLSLLGAVILMDYMYFETAKKSDKDDAEDHHKHHHRKDSD